MFFHSLKNYTQDQNPVRHPRNSISNLSELPKSTTNNKSLQSCAHSLVTPCHPVRDLWSDLTWPRSDASGRRPRPPAFPQRYHSLRARIARLYWQGQKATLTLSTFGLSSDFKELAILTLRGRTARVESGRGQMPAMRKRLRLLKPSSSLSPLRPMSLFWLYVAQETSSTHEIPRYRQTMLNLRQHKVPIYLHKLVNNATEFLYL